MRLYIMFRHVSATFLFNFLTNEEKIENFQNFTYRSINKLCGQKCWIRGPMRLTIKEVVDKTNKNQIIAIIVTTKTRSLYLRRQQPQNEYRIR